MNGVSPPMNRPGAKMGADEPSRSGDERGKRDGSRGGDSNVPAGRTGESRLMLDPSKG